MKKLCAMKAYSSLLDYPQSPGEDLQSMMWTNLNIA